MFSSGPNYTKLKTNLKLAQNRLKLLEKKKAEIAQKARKEIADYLATGKIERARIRVEHIIREDYLVEAMEVVEVYCDLLLARFGLVTQMKELDDGIAEAVASLVWVCPRMQNDIAELRVISDIFVQKYGPQFAEQSRTATGAHRVSEKLMHKLQLQAPPKLLVEKYLIEIAKNYNIEYEPDPQIINEEKDNGKEQYLIDLSDRNNLSGGSGSAGGTSSFPMGFVSYPTIPPLPKMPQPPVTKPFNYLPPYGGGNGSSAPCTTANSPTLPPFNYNIPPNAASSLKSNEAKDINTQFINEEFNKDYMKSTSSPSSSPDNSNTVDDGGYSDCDENILHESIFDDSPPSYSSIINSANLQNAHKPKPQPRNKVLPTTPPTTTALDLSQLPSVPSDLPEVPSTEKKPDNDDIDFDDLARRFEDLKKLK